MSCCPVRVGSPVEGPPLWTLAITNGTSIIQASPIFSIIREKPGPEVTVITFFPPQAAPINAAIEAISSSICIKTPPTDGIRSENRSAVSVEGVMGYPAKNRHPAAKAPSARAKSPSKKCAPVKTPLGSAFTFFTGFLLLYVLPRRRRMFRLPLRRVPPARGSLE